MEFIQILLSSNSSQVEQDNALKSIFDTFELNLSFEIASCTYQNIRTMVQKFKADYNDSELYHINREVEKLYFLLDETLNKKLDMHCAILCAIKDNKINLNDLFDLVFETWSTDFMDLVNFMQDFEINELDSLDKYYLCGSHKSIRVCKILVNFRIFNFDNLYISGCEKNELNYYIEGIKSGTLTKSAKY